MRNMYNRGVLLYTSAGEIIHKVTDWIAMATEA